MKPQRYNSFNLIHKGLRALLYQTGIALQQADLSDAQAGTAAVDQVADLLVLFESHAHGEDTYYNEPLQKIDAQVSQLFMKEHEEDHRLGLVLSDLIAKYKSETSPEGRRQTGRHLFYAFNEFIAFNLYHMNKEELELNEALWKHYTDAEIKATEQTVVQQIPPAKMAAYAKWIARGINDHELYHWLHEVRMAAPAQVFVNLKKTVSEQLSAERNQLLEQSLANSNAAQVV